MDINFKTLERTQKVMSACFNPVHEVSSVLHVTYNNMHLAIGIVVFCMTTPSHLCDQIISDDAMALIYEKNISSHYSSLSCKNLQRSASLKFVAGHS